MTVVQSVTGPIEAEDLGRTLMHEHVVLRSPGVYENYPWTFPRAEVIAICIEKLRALAETGVRTIVDHTPFDLGRDPDLLAEVSAASGVQIVACTGVWIQPARWFSLRDPDEIADLFVHDITVGMAGTSVRAGILKCAVDVEGVTGPVERVLRGIARAQLATGVPISTHTDAPSRSGELQQALFAEEGVDLSGVVIGHCGDSDDLDYLHAILERGSFIGMDRFGVHPRLPDDRRIATVATLCKQGHTSRMVISHDANAWSDRMNEAQKHELLPDSHYLHIERTILPQLRQARVTDAQIDTMLVENPRRVFELAAAARHPARASAGGERVA